MIELSTQLMEEVEAFVKDLMAREAPPELHYHDFGHTTNVVRYAEIIGKESNLSDDEMQLLKIAALFHDIGYINTFERHEEESAKIAADYMKDKGFSEDQIKIVVDCILATRMDETPTTLIQKVLCDADFMHFAEDDYVEQSELLRLEFNSIEKGKLSKKLFDIESLKIFNKHAYFTDYGRNVLQAKKEARYQKIIDKMLKRERRKNMTPSYGNNYSRGVETMLRTTSRTQINLNSIADNKSTILISINAIIISVIITFLASNSSEIKNIIFPIAICMTSALVTIVLAILATRPHLKWGRFTMEEVRENKVDLLFFGNFYNMDFIEYKDAVEGMISDNNNLYGSMIKNQHELGKILAKKFRLLKIAYNVFMIGFIATVVSFLIVFVMK